MAHYKVYVENGTKKIKTIAKDIQNVIPITWANYNALSSEAKNNGTVYHITDRHCTIPDASSVRYGDVTIGEEITRLNKNSYASVSRFLRFDPTNKKGLVIKAGTSVKLANGEIKIWLVDTQVDFSTQTLTAGADYFVFVDNDGVVSCSTTSTPSAGQVKIGRFHTVCVNVGTITMTAFTEQTTTGGSYLVKPYREDEDPDFYAFYNKTVSAISTGTYYNVATMPHPLSGYAAGDILPESVFCLGFHPNTLYEDAMVYDKTTDKCIDVYLQSGKGHSTRSAYNATHTVSRQQPNHEADMLAVGKLLLDDHEFTSASLGSNQKTSIYGSADVGVVGGHSDTAGRRMISAIGCEEMCGYLWQWLRDVAATLQANGTSGEWTTYDGQGEFGQSYYKDSAILAGGAWNASSICGSRSRFSNAVRSGVNAVIGGRGSSRVIRG